jgi:hypothetical protein
MNYTEQTCAILRKTNDGKDLAPRHLYLIQLVINNDASEHGIKLFEQLHEQVMTGTYDKQKVYLFDVEHITKDHEGYIYYKGHHIDHFSYYDNWEGEWEATLQAARICALLEQKGHPINSITYCWRVEEYLTKEEIEKCNDVKAELEQLKQQRA